MGARVEERGVEADVEDWFVGRGFPHAIIDYKATTDVFNRMLPLFLLILVTGVIGTFFSSAIGWTQAFLIVGSLCALLVAIATFNRFRGRRPFAPPDDVGFLEVLFFIGCGPVLGLIFSTTGNRLTTAVALLLTNLVIAGLGYCITSYGWFHMLKWGARQMAKELLGLAALLARTLPLLLLFATFLFINAEVWQVAHEIPAVFYAIVVGSIVVAAIGFLALRLPNEMVTLQKFNSWSEVRAVANVAFGDAPQLQEAGDRPVATELDRGETLNLLLLTLTAKLVQMVLVGLIVGGFYVGFGLLAIGKTTMEQWTTATPVLDTIVEFEFLWQEVTLTWELIKVSGFIAAISSLQFAVSLLTDDTYRKEFNKDLDTEIREVMAVRTLYLAHVGATPP